MTFLGVDMGGTASRWLLMDASGAQIARGNAPGATGLIADPGRRAAFVSALERIRAALPRPPLRAHLGMTGVGFTRDPAVTALCAQALALDQRQISHENDMELAWRAAFSQGRGHLVLAGTGSVGMSRRADGATVIIGGHGALIDDGGSASWIALRALRVVLRRMDEAGDTGDCAILARQLFDAIGGADWDHVRGYVYAGDRGQIGILAKAVAAAAAAGDATAITVLADAACELERLADILIARCGAAPLVFTGGVLALGSDIPQTLAKRLAPYAPQFRQLDAAYAAARYAMETA